MARSVRISYFFRKLLYMALTLSWSSGILFFVLNQWVRVAGDFGPEKHPLQMSILRLHGAGAFLMMVLFGYLVSNHIQVSWPLKKLHPFGLFLAGAICFLILSAYGLYYLGDPDLRTYLAYAHAAVGFSLPFVLAAHLIQGRKQRKRFAFRRFSR